MKRSVVKVDFLARDNSDFENVTELLIYSANKSLKPIKVEFQNKCELTYNEEDETFTFTLTPDYVERLIKEVCKSGFTITIDDNKE